MLERKDPAFKLFGMKISLPTDFSQKKSERVEDEPLKEETETLQQGGATTPVDQDGNNLDASAETNLNSRASSEIEDSGKECPKAKDSGTEAKQDEANTPQEKPLKKPDKILPCPRCNSMDTKFCYYNNYNVNQPRHFCKACQRYWTAGGTMRNVPVGAGRRKSKNSSSHFRHVMITEALHAARIDLANGTGHPELKTNGRVLNFGLDAPICESMASILNLADNKVVNGYRKHRETADECSSGSSCSSEEGSKTRREPLMQKINGFPAQMPFLNGVPWQWCSGVSSPVFCPSGYPMPVYSPTFWNGGVPNPSSVPWSSPNSLPNKKSPSSSPSSPLGKHSREGDIIKSDGSREEDQFKQKTPNVCVVVPKILRIDDPAEAAQSSIWATLGIKNESICSGGMFKGFKSKSDGKNNVTRPFPVFQDNPAALSRSLKFQETV